MYQPILDKKKSLVFKVISGLKLMTTHPIVLNTEHTFFTRCAFRDADVMAHKQRQSKYNSIEIESHLKDTLQVSAGGPCGSFHPRMRRDEQYSSG